MLFHCNVWEESIFEYVSQKQIFEEEESNSVIDFVLTITIKGWSFSR